MILDIEYKKIIAPALQLVQFILERKGLRGSDLLKNTKIRVQNGSISVLMPDYATFVDDGRKPGRMPPISALIKWIRDKNIQLPTGYTIEGFAFAIGRKIEKRGTKGKKFLDEMTRRLIELIFDYTNKLLDKKIKQI